MKKSKQYEDGEYAYSNVTGNGAYYFVGDSGEAKTRPIGFVRPPEKPRIEVVPPTRLRPNRNK